MSAKSFCLLIATVLGGFILINLTLWQYIGKDVFYDSNAHGDLKRMGGIWVPPSRTVPLKYEKQHRELVDVMNGEADYPADVLTIGDSFSNGSGGNYYQDYLCEKYDWSVLNVPSRPYNNALQVFYILLDTGLIDRIQPKVIILESLAGNMKERFGDDRLSRTSIALEGFLQSQGRSKIAVGIQQEVSNDKIIPGIMVKANLVVIRTTVHRFLQPNDYRLNDKVAAFELDRPLFSNTGWEDKILVHLPDANQQFDDETINNINKHFNEAADICQQKGILLVFMAAANKSDVYYPYIKNAPADWQETTTMQKLDALPKKYVFVNTEKIFRQVLKNGFGEEVKDIYWLDDLHFSWKGQQIIGEYLHNQLKGKI